MERKTDGDIKVKTKKWFWRRREKKEEDVKKFHETREVIIPWHLPSLATCTISEEREQQQEESVRIGFHSTHRSLIALLKKGKQTKREKKVNQYSKNPRMIHRNFDSHRLLSPRTTLGANRSASLISFKVTLSDISPNTNGTLLLSIM